MVQGRPLFVNLTFPEFGFLGGPAHRCGTSLCKIYCGSCYVEYKHVPYLFFRQGRIRLWRTRQSYSTTLAPLRFKRDCCLSPIALLLDKQGTRQSHSTTHRFRPWRSGATPSAVVWHASVAQI